MSMRSTVEDGAGHAWGYGAAASRFSKKATKAARGIRSMDFVEPGHRRSTANSWPHSTCASQCEPLDAKSFASCRMVNICTPSGRLNAGGCCAGRGILFHRKRGNTQSVNAEVARKADTEPQDRELKRARRNPRPFCWLACRLAMLSLSDGARGRAPCDWHSSCRILGRVEGRCELVTKTV
jgi:hypothetical protein